MTPLDLAQLLSPAHWFDGNPGGASAWYWIPGIIFLAAVIAGIYSYAYLKPTRFAAHALHARMAEVTGIAGISIGLWGLFLLLMRFLGVGLLSARILLYLTVLAGIGMIGYAIYWYKKAYPGRLLAQQRDDERKRFLPTPKTSRPKTKPATSNGSVKKTGAAPVNGKAKTAAKAPGKQHPPATGSSASTKK